MSGRRISALIVPAVFLPVLLFAAPEPFEKEFKREWETKRWGLNPYPGEENDLVFLAPEKDETGSRTGWKRIEIRKLDGKVVARAEAPAEILLLRPGGRGRALVLTKPDEREKAQHLLEIDAKGATVWSLKVPCEEAGLHSLSCADCTSEGGTLVVGLRAAEKGFKAPDCGGREVGKTDRQVVAELDGDGKVLRELVWQGPDLPRGVIRSARASGEKAVLLTAADGVYEVDWTGKILRTIHSQRRSPHDPDAKQDLHYLDAQGLEGGRFLVAYAYHYGGGSLPWDYAFDGRIRGRVAEIDAEGKEIWSAGCGVPRWIQALPTDAILVWQGEVSKMPPLKIQGSSEGAVAMELHRRGNGGIRERAKGSRISRWYSKEHGPFLAKGPVCRVRVPASPDSRLDDEQIKELYKQGLMK